MRFAIDQRFAHPPAAVAAAYADPGLYQALQDLPKLSPPELLAHEVDGDTVALQLRYRFDGDLSSAARAVLDPDRLSWVEHSRHHVTAGAGTFRMVPDHYGDRFRCDGTFRVEPLDGGSRRRVEGDLRVRAPLVAGAVERAIISGLREHLDGEVAIVDAYLAGP